ncbi:hypothetical protein [Phocaeicola salanitronis]|uniref:hypothetical protein n=1 Tax=Phocaeicola salanitronis TaxID=376805 RepID=UPI0023F7C926|nr:hypothetical protein [Phocaeicola salanitronis]
MSFRSLLKNLFGDNSSNRIENPYDLLTWNQKLAAMNLMAFLGGSCSGTALELNKINHIMSVEGGKMGVSGNAMRAGRSQFSDVDIMVTALMGANRGALENLFWAFYCIVAVGKSKEAVQMLLGIYRRLGFSEQDCALILEKRV